MRKRRDRTSPRRSPSSRVPRALVLAELPAKRRKVERVRLLLEGSLGTPRQAPRRPAPLDTLVATMLSQHTNDRNSHRAYTALRHRFGSWAQVVDAPIARVVAAIRGGGMARQKAPRIRSVLQTVRRRFGGYSLERFRLWSDDRVMSELMSLEGVGVKTASCVLLFSLGRHVFPVDTHIHRVCRRLGLVNGCRTPEQTFHEMAGLVRTGTEYSLHTNLIRFGRRICRAQNPLCGSCPLYEECIEPGRKARRMDGASAVGKNFMLLDNLNR